MDKTVLTFQDVSLGYGQVTILQGLNLHVSTGQVVALMGGSGSGKTTLLRAATGQIFAQKGQISLFGQDIRSWGDLSQVRQRMGVLFQQGALFTDLNVFENVAFPLRELRQCTEEEINQKVLSCLEKVGLKAAAHLSTSEISGGMARRVALARAIILDPEIIFFDEPFAGLDPISLGITAKLIRDLTTHLNCASILITHDIEESFAIVDQVYMVGQGRMLASGTPDDLRRSTDPYVRQFLSASTEGPVAFNYPETPAYLDWLKTKGLT
ncbi:ABC transporter ATP-binding protein [Basilea psittacipulmonis]|uniref:Toluene ABC transporter ATP-binding protein n=1 Tax=Basilea psittacipulmonis DSM 24701 TaxID=1072685 RepID=A0A077DGR9_9BURK|nr:ABC transporter ATP-binding protein [Basilea psittacipulmonis]AIL33331.1 toluene ABC transporter ATP-binding protein [Basilea psittacipulmonis DSM 24701]